MLRANPSALNGRLLRGVRRLSEQEESRPQYSNGGDGELEGAEGVTSSTMKPPTTASLCFPTMCLVLFLCEQRSGFYSKYSDGDAADHAAVVG